MTLHVLILTPRGRGGVGGIDRLMDTLRAEAPGLAPAAEIAFATTRGRSLAESPLRMAGVAARLLVQRLRGRLDVVHINLGSNLSAYRKALLAALCRALRIPYVIHLHGADFDAFWPSDRSLRRRMIDAMFLEAAGVIVLGRKWAQLLDARLPQLAARPTIIPNATPVPASLENKQTDGEIAVLFLGELGPRKGVPILLNAMARLRPEPPWSAVLAGEGALAQARITATNLGLTDRVAIPGWAGPDETAALLARADILVLPSFAENQPLAVIEAMASGLAVVATPVGATKDIVEHDVTGLLVEPGEVEGLASALQRLIDDPALRRRLGEAAQGFHREHLDSRVFAGRLATVWREASRRGGGGGG